MQCVKESTRGQPYNRLDPLEDATLSLSAAFREWSARGKNPTQEPGEDRPPRWRRRKKSRSSTCHGKLNGLRDSSGWDGDKTTRFDDDLFFFSADQEARSSE